VLSKEEREVHYASAPGTNNVQVLWLLKESKKVAVSSSAVQHVRLRVLPRRVVRIETG